MLLDEMVSFVDAIKAIENYSNTSPVEQLRNFIRIHVETVVGRQKVARLYFEMEVRYLSQSHRAEIIRLRNVYDETLRKIIRRGIDNGVFAEVNEKLANYAIASTIMRCRLWYSPEGELSVDEIAENLSAIFINGLLSRPTRKTTR